MRNAAGFVLVSALFHVVGAALTGFGAEGRFLLIPAVLFVTLTALLARQFRGVTWLAFILMLGSTAAAVAELVTLSPYPNWVLWGILLANLCAIGALFGAIWTGPQKAFGDT